MDISKLNQLNNQPNRKNPFRSKPIPKGKIESAINATLSIRAAAQHLGVSYNTFKKYAKKYELFEQNKNQSGVGITTKGNTGWGIKLDDIFDGKNPNYPHWKLQERVIRNGYVAQECSNCGYCEVREKDLRGPFLICFFDGDGTNHKLENLHLLCYNCFFIVKPTGRMLTTPKNVTLLRKKLEEVWVEKDD